MLAFIVKRGCQSAQPFAATLLCCALLLPACTPQIGSENVGAAQRSDIDYSFVIWQIEMPAKLPAGEITEVPVTLINTGNSPWIGTEEKPFFLSYHWKHPGGRFNSDMFWGERTELPRRVGTGQMVTVNMIVKAPEQAKYYDIVIDIVHGRGRERSAVSWFEETGWRTHNLRVEAVAQ